MHWVMVTGCEGYIGSILCKRLQEQGYMVIGVDNTKYPAYKSGNVDIFINECFTSDKALKTITDQKVKTVYHLAAHSLLGPSAYEPSSYYENNTARTAKLVDKLRSINIVFASTAAVYAEQDRPLNEDDLKGSPNVYGRSKHMCEQILHDVSPRNLLNTISFRFFNVIGAYRNLKQRSTEPHLLNQIRNTLVSHKTSSMYGLATKKLKVFGRDYQTRDGSCIRDFVHVLDICDAMIHAGRMLECKQHSQLFKHKQTCYNLASGSGTSVLEMIDQVQKVTGKEIPHQLAPRRIGDPAFLVANPQKFIDDTKFKYQHTVEQAIASVME